MSTKKKFFLSRNKKKNQISFYLKIFLFWLKIYNIFEQACFHNVRIILSSLPLMLTPCSGFKTSSADGLYFFCPLS